MAAPSISVLLPVRNGAATLDEALDSLWDQSHGDFEVVAVDDGSEDATPDILVEHEVRDPRLRVLRTGPRGLVPALESARAAACGHYLARMDADDFVHPDRLELQLEYLAQHPRTAAVGSKVTLYPREKLQGGWIRYETWLNSLLTPEDHAREIFVESPLAHPSVMLRREALEEVGGYRDAGWAEDYDLWLRLNAAGWELAKVNRTLLGWRHDPGRLTVTSDRYSLDAFMAARAHYLALHPAIRGHQVRVWGAGRTGRRLSRALHREGVRPTGYYEVDPARIGGRFADAPVSSWEDLPPAGGFTLLVAVGAAGARDLIRPEVRRRGYREGVDVFFTA
jgi:glycosyltransferase involved in cell wall biosynthesis